MTEIEMDTDLARMQSGNLENVIKNLGETKANLLVKDEFLRSVWQSPSAEEFRAFHRKMLTFLEQKILDLRVLKGRLDEAIQLAEEAAQTLAGG